MLKAKWHRTPGNNWFTAIGPYDLYVEHGNARATASISCNSARMWSQQQRAPYDVQDLMRLAEEELSRRLAAASETLSGETLEAEEPATAVRIEPATTRPIEIHVEVKSEQMMTVGMWKTLAQSWLAKAAVVSAAAAEPYGLTTSRRCSHEGCTTPPLPDSWVCREHERGAALDNIGTELEPLTIATGFGLDVHGSRLGEPRRGRTDHDYRLALFAVERAIHLMA